MEFMKSGESVDAVVGDPFFIEAWLVEGKTTVPWAVLNEDGRTMGNSANLAGGRVIAKYQSLPALLESILQLSDVMRTRTASASQEQTLMLGVVSASGSSGKTTLALNMAKQLSGLGLSVFYLNLESVDSSGLFVRLPAASTSGLERLLYELKAGRGEDGKDHEDKLELGRYVVRHDVLRCEVFRPVENFKEMLQMTRQDTLDLLDLLAAAGGYDIVVIDTGSIEEERTQAVLQRCGMLLWMLRNDEASRYKTMKWLEHGNHPHSGWPPDIQKKSRFVMNFATDSVKDEPVSEGMKLDALLPHIPSWALQHHVELCLSSPQFMAGVQQLCEVIVEPALPRLFTGNVHE
jgi:cellulose biosynthesis protein BcsQ